MSLIFKLKILVILKDRYRVKQASLETPQSKLKSFQNNHLHLYTVSIKTEPEFKNKFTVIRPLLFQYAFWCGVRKKMLKFEENVENLHNTCNWDVS